MFAKLGILYGQHDLWEVQIRRKGFKSPATPPLAWRKGKCDLAPGETSALIHLLPNLPTIFHLLLGACLGGWTLEIAIRESGQSIHRGIVSESGKKQREEGKIAQEQKNNKSPQIEGWKKSTLDRPNKEPEEVSQHLKPSTSPQTYYRIHEYPFLRSKAILIIYFY